MPLFPARCTLCLLFCACCLALLSCQKRAYTLFRFTYSDAQTAALFRSATEKPQIKYWRYGDRTIRYLTIGADSLPPVIMLHGSPGSWSSFQPFFTDTALFHRARLIAPDRPGFGYSNFGRSFISIRAEADLLNKFLDSVVRPDERLVVVGSSYGGSVAVRLAVQNASRLKGLVLISASVAPGEEKIYGISPFIDVEPWRRIVPRLLLSPNDQKLAHRRALKDIDDGWERITAPVYILHGKRDNLVYFTNAEYAHRKLVAARVTMVPFPDLGHDINWKHNDTVRHYVREALREGN